MDGKLFRIIPSKVVRVGSLPKRVGAVQLVFVLPPDKEGKSLPRREDNVVYLPVRGDLSFCKFESEESFIVFWEQCAWYGGSIHGIPFFTMIHPSIISELQKNGEEGFLKATTPTFIQGFEHHFCGKPSRIGPVVAYPLGLNWDQINMLASAIGGRRLEYFSNTKLRIPETDLSVYGNYARYGGSPMREGKMRLVSGVIACAEKDVSVKEVFVLNGVNLLMPINGLNTTPGWK